MENEIFIPWGRKTKVATIWEKQEQDASLFLKLHKFLCFDMHSCIHHEDANHFEGSRLWVSLVEWGTISP